jgi:hypothetical protein
MHFQTSDASGSSPNLITAMSIDDSQHVITGTTSNSYPKGKFTIHATPGVPATSGTSTTNVGFRLGTTSGNSQVLDMGVYNASPYGSWIQTSGAGEMSATSPLILNPNGGNVGIGLTAPSEKLVVNVDSAGIKAGLILNNEHGYGSGVGVASTALQFSRDNTPAGGQTIITGQIYSGNETETTSNPGFMAFSTKSGSSPYTVTERMRIDSAGKIKIGNNIPVWSGSYGGGLFLKGNNATGDRYAQLCIVDSTGAIAQQGLKVNNNGSATFGGTGDVTITDGNLVVASGHGIDFSVNSNASGMSSEVLDDYEEGTWTPQFNGNHIGSHSTYYARYTKIGNLVYVSCYVYNLGSISGTGVDFGIVNLPFANGTHANGTASISECTWDTSTCSVTSRLHSGVWYVNQDKLSSVTADWLTYDQLEYASHVQMTISYWA